MKIIAANWKMNNGFDEADVWLEAFKKGVISNQEKFREIETVLCPPAVLIDYVDSELMQDGFEELEFIAQKKGLNFNELSEEEVKQVLVDERPVKLGAQDCHFEKSGSFTGDVSARMLKDVGCEYVILGHSERRAAHFETNEIVAKKVRSALGEALIPIICVGESKEVRDRSEHVTFVLDQILQSVPQDVKYKKLVIAYEPIWSIGTGVVPTSEQIKEMAYVIKKLFDKKFSAIADEFFLLYGGSVTAQNSAEILRLDGVNGLLVGKASLDAGEFVKICIG